MFVVILYERLLTFCFNYGLVGHGASNCNRRHGGSPEYQTMGKVFDGGNLSKSSWSNPKSSQVRLVATRPSEDWAPCVDVEDGKEYDFGSWILATRRRNRECGRGGAGLSSSRGSHVCQARRDESFPTVGSIREDVNLTVGLNGRHMESNSRFSGARGGSRSCDGGRGGFSHQSSDRSFSTMHTREEVAVLGIGAPSPVLTHREEHLVESPKDQGMVKLDRKGKKLLIEALGFIAGQLLSNVMSRNKRGSFFSFRTKDPT